MAEPKDSQSLAGQDESNLSAKAELQAGSKDAICQSGEDVLDRMGKAISSKPQIETPSLTIAKFKADDILAGKYQILKFLSQGSAGIVYQARHIMLDKIFAIKVFSPHDITKESSGERFQREAHAASSLSHPNIIIVHDFGTLPEGSLYLAMEYLEGETLAALLEKKEKLLPQECLPIFKQVCLALEYAHTQGVIHRDLKPSNIMLVKDYKGDNVPKVIDFSIAKFTRQRPNQRTITKPGQIFGTPLYMSPEQCQGKKPDHRSDIYSLGCVMYESFCGVPPLMGDTQLNTIYMHVNELPIPFSQYIKDFPKELEAIIFKALAKQPENRYQSAAELRAALEAFEQRQSRPKELETARQVASGRGSSLKTMGVSILVFLLICFALVFCILLNGRIH